MPGLDHLPRHYVPLSSWRRLLSAEGASGAGQPQEVPCAAPAAPTQSGREIAPKGKLPASRGDLGSAGPGE